MPSFKPKAPWEAEPHTLAKIEIVRRYLFLWFRILATNPRNTRLVYIDGFAGPGEYTNCDSGSPIAALEAARAAIEDAKGQMDKTQLDFLFVEKTPALAAHLRSKVASVGLPESCRVEVKEGEFANHVGEFLKLQGPSGPPTFAFVDPFGATKVPFDIIAGILRYPRCEILLNLDSDGIGRVLGAQSNAKNQANLTTLFGDDSWKQLHSKNTRQMPSAVLALYKKKLRATPGVKYVFPFAMNSRTGQLNYHLVFASQYFLGLEKMKEAMKAVDKSGAYSFSDDFSSQALLEFDFSAPAHWAERMVREFGGSWQKYEVFRDFALNETPFVNPKSMFEHLKRLDQIHVSWKGDPATTGFPEEKIASILLMPKS